MNNNYAIYVKKPERDFFPEELKILDEMRTEIMQYPDSTFEHNEENIYIFVHDVQENLNGIAVFYTENEDEIFLSKLFVRPIDRRQGIATMVVAKLQEMYETISLGIHKDNEYSKKLFEYFNPTHICEYMRITKN